MKISNSEAALVLQSAIQTAELASCEWVNRISHLSDLCSQGNATTHIAFFGTSLLARATSAEADLRAIKPSHASDNPNAYSARNLAHQVLVPIATEHRIHIGVTGREPLNNQPYFRMTHLGDGTPVRGGSKPAFDYMCSLIDELQASTPEEALAALRAFVQVRQKHWPQYQSTSAEIKVSSLSLARAIEQLVKNNSEGGARAQAAAAGLLDIFAGTNKVYSGRVNDPSREHPGDVCIGTPNSWEKAFEVRDKPVTNEDVRIFALKCLTAGVREAALLMVDSTQKQLNDEALKAWGVEQGIGLTLFYGWERFTHDLLFWSPLPQTEAAISAVKTIENRLIGAEVETEAISIWHSLTREK